MAYSLDLRRRVVAFVEGGGSKAEAARHFSVSRVTVYAWLSMGSELKAGNYPARRRTRLDWDALAQHVRDYPDLLLRERAAHFGVTANGIHHALKRLKITHKKNS